MRHSAAAASFVFFGALAACSSHHDDCDALVEKETTVESLGAPSGSSGSAALSPRAIQPRLLKRFRPLSKDAFATVANDSAVDLGHRLFFDPRLSALGDVSCFSCHDLAHGGADPHATSAGSAGRHGDRNAPTILNAAGAFAQLWDGRAATLEAQALLPLWNPNVMGPQSPDDVVRRLKAIAGYRQRFESAFPTDPEPVTLGNVSSAIAAYERKLATPGRWDKFLEGDQAALTSREKEGLRIFLGVGCMVCHTGPLVGGSSFERLGAVVPWPSETDTGRMRATSDARDRMMFKVPTLRNVARTAPYFHDGSAATLDEAVKEMADHQLGIELTELEVASIVCWLNALDGDADPALTAAPALP